MHRPKKMIFLILIILIALTFCFFFVGQPKPAENIKWGVVFSQKHSELFGLDWKENYLAILDDLKVKHLKIVAYWDLIEKEPGVYDFEGMDFQVEEAEKRGVKLLFVLGQKVPRWPECHFPGWTGELTKEERNQRVLEFIEKVVLRYRDSEAIEFWQVENEPFFIFGECPPPDEKFLRKEVDLVKSLDNERQIVITESGELLLWFKAARFGDIVGHTLYREIWVSELKRYFNYPFPPVFYNRKAWLVNKFVGKEVMCVELQAEPWGPVLLYDLPLEEQEKTMDLDQFKKNISFAKRTGIDTFYLWGSEWWYWMKEIHKDDAIWKEAQKLFILEK